MKIVFSAKGGQISNYGKRMVAKSMYDKGKNFLGAAMLLREKGGYEYAVLHLLCQGIEITLKALLLFKDYDFYKPTLKQYSHDLLALAIDVLEVFSLHPFRQSIQKELQVLNSLYSKHLLRYASNIDLLIDPKSIQSHFVLRRIAAVIRLSDRELSRGVIN